MKKRSLRGDGGFTLLEVMVALTILSFILGVVYTTFATLAESDRQGAALLESNVRVRNLADYLMRDLSSLVIDAQHTSGPGTTSGLTYGLVSGAAEGGGSRLDFTALSSDSGDLGGAYIAEIGYFLRRSEEEGSRLFKRMDETPDDNIEEGGHFVELMEGISALSFLFLDDKGEWVSQWDSRPDNKLPGSIKVIIAFDGDEEARPSFFLQVPVYVGTER